MSTVKQETSPAWTPSHREEIISALWFIVAFAALGAGAPRWVFLFFIIKAGLDMLTAIRLAIREIRADATTDTKTPPK